MSSRRSFASILTAGLLAVGGLGMMLSITGASAGQGARKPHDGARAYQLESRRSIRGPRIRLPMGPSYIYYDYPYYYSRGYYPTHIGGYIYEYPFYERGGRRCSVWRQKCLAAWSHTPRSASARRPRGACRCR